MEGSGSLYAATLHRREENEVEGGRAVVRSEGVVARRLLAVAEGLIGGFGGRAALNHLACCPERRLFRSGLDFRRLFTRTESGTRCRNTGRCTCGGGR